MKKLKEFLMFFIPFAGLSSLSVVSFAIRTQGSVGCLQLILLMFTDSFFIRALMHTFVPSILMSLVVCLIYKLLVFFMKRKMPRIKDYILLFVLSLLPPVVYIFVVTRTFHINNTIFTLQVGIIVTLIFWLAELVKESIRKHVSKEPDAPKE